MATGFPVVFIVGPTGSGKTSLAVRLAKQYSGEIICADSRTIFTGMNIGTAKPTREEQAIVPHWGLDLIEPGNRFTAADFKVYAQQKIDAILARGNVPFVVGGTGLYINGLLYNFQFNTAYDPELRASLSLKTIKELQNECIDNNLTLPVNSNNKRHLIRAIEQKDVSDNNDHTMMSGAVVVGLTTNRNTGYDEILRVRAEHMFANGVVEEATMLGNKYGWDNEAMTGNIYPLIRQFIDGEIDKNLLTERFIVADRHLAKRQMTWFKRDENIIWKSVEEAEMYLSSVLSEHFS